MNEPSLVSVSVADAGAIVSSPTGVLESPKDDVGIPASSDAEPLDFSALVARCMGNTEIANRALKKFEVCFAQDLTQLEQRFAELKWDETRLLAHRLRGSAASVAAPGLVLLSSELEELVKTRRFTDIPWCLGRLRREWSRFLASWACHGHAL